MKDNGTTVMLSALDLVRRIEACELKPSAVVDMCAAAIAARESDVHAFAALDLESARGVSDSETLTSLPLRGLPIAFKDIYDTTNFATEYGSRIYAGHRPAADATAVVMARQAGGVCIGKTGTTEFASMVSSVTRNPHNLEHTPGGSSSGSCAAVAAGMVPIAFGTQTAGSVIRPASFCGVAGFKPSYRLIPMVGVKTVSWHLDTAGLFAARIADVAFAAAAVTGRDLRVDGTALAPPRIGLARTHHWGEASPSMQHAVEAAARAAEAAGAKVADLILPSLVQQADSAQHVIQDYETARSLAFELESHRLLIDARLREALERGWKISNDDYDAARRTASRARRELADAMANHDVILTPSAPGAAPRGLETTGDPKFNRLWTVMGAPCANVPGLTDGHLPLGIQIVGRFGRDRSTLEAASFVEQAIAQHA